MKRSLKVAQGRPNKGMELTASSVRYASASGSSSGLPLAAKDQQGDVLTA
jgi:hypothetical protein